MTESFRSTTSTPTPGGRKKPLDFNTQRNTAEASPSAILAGIVIHGNRAMVRDIKPNAFKRMDPVVATALQCDLTGYEAEIKARMIEAGLTAAEVEDLWAVSAQAAREARKRETDKSIKLSPEDANRRAFNVAQADLIGFMKEAGSNEIEESKESFR